MDDDAAPFEALKETVYENTYITSPRGHGDQHVCQRHKIRQVVQGLIRTRVKGFSPRRLL